MICRYGSSLWALLRRGRALWRLAALGLLCSGPVFAAGYQIGVYYFPGWKNHQPHAPSALPWDPIRAFPEREPLLGWYDEGMDDVIQQQLDWMHTYGIDYVVFDWYFGADRKVYLEHALAAYLRAPNRDKVKFSILWANHDQIPKNREDWEAMVRYWVRYYFPQPEFLRVDGKPVVFVFSADELKKQAESFGVTSKDLLNSAQTIARQSGFPGIYFVGGAWSSTSMVMAERYAPGNGYSALSAYNYHDSYLYTRSSNGGAPEKRFPHSYAELDQGFRYQWGQFVRNSPLPYIIPMVSGWSKRPWGGSKDPLHDNSVSTPEVFGEHLRAARTLMDANPVKTMKMGVICCWNEFGEGSYIEPTKNYGFQYLEQVKKVFGTQ